MAKTAIAFSDWPFENGEKVKLIKISKPFFDKGRWYLNAVFMSLEKKKVKKLKRFFGDLHLLIVGAHYVDGIRQEMLDWQTETLNINNKYFLNKRIEPYLKRDRFNEEFDYYTFGIGFDDKYYVFPILEIVRAIFAPDVFWLNQITMLDTIDTRVLHEFVNRILKLNFSNDIPLRYIEMDATIKHIAWIFTNDNVLKMLNQIYQNICDNKGILFDFNFNDLAISFKYEESDRMRYVKEIIVFRRKQILCEEIFVSHPGLIEHDPNSQFDEKKKCRFNKKHSSGVKKLAKDEGALANLLDIELNEFINFEYTSFVKIKREKKIKNIDKNKILHLKLDNDNATIKRTTADFGGLEAVPQLEFFQSTIGKLDGEFGEIQEILNLMKEREAITEVGLHIGCLNDHFQKRAICTLDDKKTLRKYMVGRIQLQNKTDVVIIEIQRENKSLSTLLCLSLVDRNWNQICHKILKSFVQKSGIWPDLNNIGLSELISYRFKHTNIDVIKKELRILKKILSR